MFFISAGMVKQKNKQKKNTKKNKNKTQKQKVISDNQFITEKFILVNFKWSQAGLNSELFSYTSCLIKAKEPNMPYYLSISGR